jgi:hypothetical protein
MHRIGTDPFDGWMYAGRCGAAVTFGSQTPLLWGWMDVDGDGLPDWWERLYGFDPYNADTDGNDISDFYDDPDHDGLPNFAELLAGTDPRNPDTDFDGYSDYDSPPTSWQPYGVRYTDNDYTEDRWESLYAPQYASADHYDSQLDPDDDGWDNWSEARYTAQSGVNSNAVRLDALEAAQLWYPLAALNYASGAAATSFGMISITTNGYVNYQVPNIGGATGIQVRAQIASRRYQESETNLLVLTSYAAAAGVAITSEIPGTAVGSIVRGIEVYGKLPTSATNDAFSLRFTRADPYGTNTILINGVSIKYE